MSSIVNEDNLCKHISFCFLGNMFEVGGFQKTLHNFWGWSDQSLTCPYKGRYMVENMAKTPLRN